MKTILLACLVVTGCARRPGTYARYPSDDSPPPTPSASLPVQTEDNSARFITPVDGSGTTLATPIGGGMYLPVGGGPPVIGI